MKMREIALYGSQVIKITGSYDQCKQVAAEFANQRHLYPRRYRTASGPTDFHVARYGLSCEILVEPLRILSGAIHQPLAFSVQADIDFFDSLKDVALNETFLYSLFIQGPFRSALAGCWRSCSFSRWHH